MALIEPLAELDLKIDNAAYEQYDAQDLFIADFISKLKKAIRQWKQKLESNQNNNVFATFLQELALILSEILKENIKKQSLSLLGALYLEKVIRKIKSFL